MAKDYTNDAVLEKQLKTRLDELIARYDDRNDLLDECEKMYNLDWDADQPGDPAFAKTMTTSPDPFNKCNNAIRLLTAANPNIHVPYESNSPDARKQSDKLEKYLNTTVSVIDRVRGKPLVVDAATSGAVLNGIYGCVVPTKTLVESTRKLDDANPRNNALKRRYEKIAKQTSYMVELYDPRTCYPEFDQYGLVAIARQVDNMKGADVVARWGDLAYSLAGIKPDDLETEVEYSEYWDDVIHATWAGGKILNIEEHGYPCLPWAAVIVEGTTSLFTEAKYQEHPFLYALNKSNLWIDQNIALTAMYSSVLRMGALPQMLYKKKPMSEGTINPDYSQLGGVITIETDEDFGALTKRPVDPALVQSLDLANQMVTASTMYDQTVGAPIGASATFSATALLSQQGRIVLVALQRAMSQFFGKVSEIMLELTREGYGNKVQSKESVISIDRKDVPEEIFVDAMVDVKMPQDERQNALVALQTVGNKLVSKRFARENYLQIGQSADMEKEILDEDVMAVILQLAAQQQIAQAQQQAQGQMQGVSPEQGQMMQQGGGTAAGMPAMQPGGPMPTPGETGQIPFEQQGLENPA